MCIVFLPGATPLPCLLSGSSLQLTEFLGKGSSLALGSNALVNNKLMNCFFFLTLSKWSFLIMGLESDQGLYSILKRVRTTYDIIFFFLSGAKM